MKSFLLPGIRRLHNHLMYLREVVHDAAKHGFTPESAKLYEQGRPSYPVDCLRIINKTIMQSYHPSPAPLQFNLVEIGAGTGKFTESFVPYFQQHYVEKKEGKSLIFTAVEPSEGFRDTLAQKKLQGVVVVNGTGEAVPVPSRSADAVIIAQAFHWMDSVTTLKEVYRVLKPGGVLFVLFNAFDYSTEWLRILDKDVVAPRFGSKVPRPQSENWRNCFFLEETKPMFSALHGWYHPFIFYGTRNMVLNRYLSISVIVSLSKEEKMKVLHEINNFLDFHPAFEKSRENGVYEFPYVTQLLWTYRR
jgi:ubiquinone/menaquinone biosynthesis C-methylase UbiE